MSQCDMRVLTTNMILVPHATRHDIVFFHEPFSDPREGFVTDTFASDLAMLQIKVPALGKLFCPGD